MDATGIARDYSGRMGLLVKGWPNYAKAIGWRASDYQSVAVKIFRVIYQLFEAHSSAIDFKGSA
jgi:hypothetical protein